MGGCSLPLDYFHEEVLPHPPPYALPPRAIEVTALQQVQRRRGEAAHA
jgi:hypothetical protein